MKKQIIRYTTVLLAFLAGLGFMNYITRMGNRDMTGTQAQATLPVAYAEKDGQLYNEMHGYVEAMDGSYMKEQIIGLSADHRVSVAVEKYNARINGLSYEVRTLDMSRLIESGEITDTQDDGKYIRFTLDLKDLLDRGEKYLFILKADTQEQGEVNYYSLISYLGENHVKECVDFAQEFHRMTIDKEREHTYLQYLEPNGSMDGKSLGYVNIHSRSGPITWGDMSIRQVTDTKLRFTAFEQDVTAMALEYCVQNTQTDETYQVSEAFRVRYTSSRMYLLAYERKAERIFEFGRQLVEDGEIFFGIQSGDVQYMKNNEENIIAFVQQGQLWCYDFAQNRLSLVYGFQDGDDARGLYNAHAFRLLDLEDSGSMDFLIYGYMNRGRYEGMSGVLLCHYDALLSTVEEQFFIASDRPYEAMKEDLGKLAVENDRGTAWISYRGAVLQVELSDCTVKVLAGGIEEDQLQVSDSGLLAAWSDDDYENISLLNTRTGKVNQITSGEGEALLALGFMEEDFIYGNIYREDIWTDPAGRQVLPVHRVVIRDHSGNQVREFDYLSRGKYVTGVSIVENRIDLSCVTRAADGSYEEALPEPITYTNETAAEKMVMKVRNDEIKRNEYHLTYGGTLKGGSMKKPLVKLVLYERSRTLQFDMEETGRYLAYTFDGRAEGFDMLAEAVIYAQDGMGSVWKDGFRCFWERGNRLLRTQIPGFENAEAAESGSSQAQCLQFLLNQRQVYTDVQAALDSGMALWEICERELGESCCILPGCSLNMALYYVNKGAPVMAVTDTGGMVLIVGYDAQNITYYEPGKAGLTKGGMKDSTAMFQNAGNLFFTYLP